ncbi:branched-chain amino acid transport system II carrier protein [Photobacterium sp. SDRW27]|uniref:branched-chain amino acid transport system II carrier protein n=1 Tax=Photobacterium obscurum TaxID=2829490 RepID=UPI002244B180|nr:branched-chain amino acid transport system II carrier protein [Photobacterium obscurum]MCW8331205.1 branched-chain amino acid transport system II carrier protein [Photobacterium obscurum]
MKTHDLLAIGLMTFALFLGAGNLIFPPSLGLEAGTNLFPAMVGFLVTAVGLPALTLIVLGRISSTQNLTKPLPSWLARSFWIALFTAIGPAFGMPRAVTVAYEMGIKPFVTTDHLLLFSVLFSAFTLMLAFKPGRLVDCIGKVMTPLLILMLLALTLAAIISPLDTPLAPTADYQHGAVTQGLIQGYMTMDAIAAVGFGWVIIQTINAKGVTAPKAVANTAFKVAMIYAVLMAGCYMAMGYVGATSASVATNATNGGEILARYVAGEFGVYGQWLLAAIIIMACLTTTVGLTNACAEYYKQTFNASFSVTATIVVLLTGIIANFGLEQILAVSLPAILVLCPVAIALVLAALAFPAKPDVSFTYIAVLMTAMVFGGLDALTILGKMPESLDMKLTQLLPLYSAHASWFLPCLTVLFFSRMLAVSRKPLIQLSN